MHETKKAPFDTIFPQGPVNPYGKFFTGTSYLTMLSENDDLYHAPIGNVTFEPGTRTHWHVHSGGQILLVLAGEGFVQFEGALARPLAQGDVVRIPPNVKHWHGAKKGTWFTHISIEPNVPNNRCTWLEPVSNEIYEAAHHV